MERVRRKVESTTYKAIAASAGVDLSHVSRIMTGERTPSLPVAQRIAKHLGVSLDNLADYLFSLHKEPVAA